VKVVLREDVPQLGKRGQVVRVADGYGRNFLIPKKMAYQATEGTLRQVEIEGRASQARLEQDRLAARSVAERIESLGPLRFVKKAGEGETLYGSVTTAEIAEALGAQGLEIDRRKIELEAPIKRTGTHQIAVHLYEDVRAELTIEVEPEA
jgi:large subunit ribosomal protein L9